MPGSRGLLETTRRLAAYHEAGHAVASFYRPETGRTVRVSIRRADLAAGDAGMHVCRTPPPRDGLEAVRASAVVTLAGAEVDRRLTHDAFTSGEADYEAVRALLFRAILDREIEEVVSAVTLDEARTRGLEQIAAEASEAVEDHLKRLFDELRREARTLVDAKWPEIEAVARALLEREALSGDEVESIIARVEGDRTRAEGSRTQPRHRDAVWPAAGRAR